MAFDFHGIASLGLEQPTVTTMLDALKVMHIPQERFREMQVLSAWISRGHGMAADRQRKLADARSSRGRKKDVKPPTAEQIAALMNVEKADKPLSFTVEKG
jgi:hypothetical protein